MAIFTDVIYADIVGGWVRKSPKLCWRNLWMVPKDDSWKTLNLTGFWRITKAQDISSILVLKQKLQNKNKD